MFYSNTPLDGKLSENDEFICFVCMKEYVDPRVLPCLHWFCLECLNRLILDQNCKSSTTVTAVNERFRDVVGSFSRMSFSKNDYKRLKPVCEANAKELKCNNFNSKEIKNLMLKCPKCGFDNKISSKGAQNLPPHYLLQHRMLVNSLNKGQVCLLCDMCPSEIPAKSRCTKCLLNLCSHCSKLHKKEKLFPDHELKELKRSNQAGVGITKIRRQAMCSIHAEKQLNLFCSTCNKVICSECRGQFHSSHSYECSSQAAQVFSSKMKDRMEKTKLLSRETLSVISRFDKLSNQIELRSSEVEAEVNSYMDSYIDAVNKHRKKLLTQVVQIRNEQTQNINIQQKKVKKKFQEMSHTLKFGEDLLSEGSDFEVLSFAFNLLQRLELLITWGNTTLKSILHSCFETLYFLPNERAGNIKDLPVFGIITTQTVSPLHSYIIPEGLVALQNCRVNERCELTLITADYKNHRVAHGAEGIEVDLRFKNRQIPIFMVDQQNGVYLISFTPEVIGKMCLSVTIRGVPIKGSPFEVYVRGYRSHKGVFHCCSFCSSGGSKHAFCGCGSRMPGYQGCGHGYLGHPGQPHWSCCGNTYNKSECFRAIGDDGFYQLNL